MTALGMIGGLGPESTIDYYRRILEAWEQVEPGMAPSIVIDSLDVRRGLRLVESDRPGLTSPASKESFSVGPSSHCSCRRRS